MNESHLKNLLRLSAISFALVAMPAPAADSVTSGGTTSGTVQVGGTVVVGTTPPPTTQPRPDGRNVKPSSRLFERYSEFIGSDADTRSVIQGLRYGEMISLGGGESSSGSIRFLPPTRPMGWGNIDRALSLARSELVAQGITQPTAEQLKAALMGGSVVAADGTAVQLKGVLVLRSQGMGWGEVAHAVDVSPAGRSAGSKLAGSTGASSGKTGTRTQARSEAGAAVKSGSHDPAETPRVTGATSTAGADTTVTGSGLKQAAPSSERARVSFTLPAPGRPAGTGAEASHGAIVTAGGSLFGGAPSVSRGTDARGGGRGEVESNAGVAGNERGWGGASAHGVVGASSVVGAASVHGHSAISGNAGSSHGGTGGSGGLGLGRR